MNGPIVLLSCILWFMMGISIGKSMNDEGDDMDNLYEPDDFKQWTGIVSQCFSCANKKCSRSKMKKNNVGGIEPANNNPGVVMSSKLCKNWKDKYAR